MVLQQKEKMVDPVVVYHRGRLQQPRIHATRAAAAAVHLSLGQRRLLLPVLRPVHGAGARRSGQPGGQQPLTTDARRGPAQQDDRFGRKYTHGPLGRMYTYQQKKKTTKTTTKTKTKGGATIEKAAVVDNDGIPAYQKLDIQYE